MEEEKELGRIEAKNKVEMKRKSRNDDKPPSKRKRLENLEGWGLDEEVGDEVGNDNQLTASKRLASGYWNQPQNKHLLVLVLAIHQPKLSQARR